MNFRCAVLGILGLFPFRFLFSFGVGLGGFDVIRNEGEYVFDMIAEVARTHIIGRGNQRAREDFPVLDNWLLVGTNESG